MSLTNRTRHLTNRILLPLGTWLHRRGVHPDALTWLGLLLVALASLCIALGQLQLGGLLLLLGLPLDALDGAVARVRHQQTQVARPFGAVLDSTLDRYADGFIFIALGYYFAVLDRLDLLLLALCALLGSLLVSYVRARADGVQVSVTVGCFTRLERVLVILVIIWIPALLPWGVLLLAIGTHITALQRLWVVYRVLKRDGN